MEFGFKLVSVINLRAHAAITQSYCIRPVVVVVVVAAAAAAVAVAVNPSDMYSWHFVTV